MSSLGGDTHRVWDSSQGPGFAPSAGCFGVDMYQCRCLAGLSKAW